MVFKMVGADQAGNFPTRVETAIRNKIKAEVTTEGKDTKELLDGIFAPISGSTAYAPASGSANYAPAVGSDKYASLDSTGKVPTSQLSVDNIAVRPATLLPTWARKRTLSQLNQAPVRILCVGDSTTAGVYSDSYTTAIGNTNQGGPNSYPAQLAKRLTSSGIPAEHSFCLPGHSGNADSRWVLGANWGYASFGAGMNSALTSSNGATSTTVTPGVVADRYVVYFYGDSGTGTVLNAQVTGGALSPINTQKTTAGVYSAVINAGSASATNVLTLTQNTGTAFVLGVEAYDSANPNKIRIMNAGCGGSTAEQWANTTNAGSINFIKGVAPDLTVISLGVNDGGANVPVATVTANINTIIAAAAVSGDVLLMSAVPHGNASILDDYNLAYRGLGRPYVDLQNRWGYSGQSMQFLTVDNTHPNAIGYGDMATAVSNYLRSI